jgi:hypothetical protein
VTRFVSSTAAVLLCAVMIQAQARLTGTWQGETDGGASLVLELKVKGSELTGALTRNGQRTTLTDGKVAKNTFTFKATLNERSESFSGALEKEDIRIWLDRQGPSKAVTLKRASAR